MPTLFTAYDGTADIELVTDDYLQKCWWKTISQLLFYLFYLYSTFLPNRKDTQAHVKSVSEPQMRVFLQTPSKN